MVTCCNNRQTYLHGRFHDQFVRWYQNSYKYCVDFFFLGGGGSVEGLTFGLCGTVNIEHDEDLGLWL